MQYKLSGAQSPPLVSGLPSSISSRLPREFEVRSRRRSSAERWNDCAGVIR
ncbi:MAG: hypothetical protein ABSC61_09395 [Anaerolineales bacterium]